MASSDEAPVSVGFVGSLGRACFSDLWLNACPGRDISYRTGTRRALLAAVAADELDIAVHPGASESGDDTLLLCDDHLIAAFGAHHPLAALEAIGAGDLRAYPLLLPMEGEEGDFRRLVQALVPGLGAISEAPLAALLQRLTTSDALALMAASQDDLRGAVVTRSIAGLDTHFSLHLTWSRRAASLGLPALLAARISPRAPACAMTRAGSGQDDAGTGAGDPVLG